MKRSIVLGNRVKISQVIFIILFVFQLVMLTEIVAQSPKSEMLPDYSVVFPTNMVNRIDITIAAKDWQKLNNSLTAKFGKSNMGLKFGPPPGMMRDSMGNRWKGDSLRMPPWGPDSMRRMGMPPPNFKGGMPPFPGGKMGPPGGMMGGPPMDTVPDIFVPATILFNNKKWNNVGFRFKGNSSLMMSWGSGIKKMPFRLNFSKFSDSIPTLKSQRFYGFKELTFSNNISDNSYLHERIASDLFRESGIKAPCTAFYEVYVDCGDGMQYFGLYNTIEIVEDAMLKAQFGNNTGNCYKPEGQSGTLALGTFNKQPFEKKNNKKKADYSDILKLIEVLNSKTRVSDRLLWMAQLDSIFDIPVFIKWLAINTTIQNWDTYGTMSHNYYLYNNPATKKLTWIPWDNNEALSSGRMGALTLSLAEVSEFWPLIRYVLDQPEYLAIYRLELDKFIKGAFEPTRIKGKIEANHQLIAPYVAAEKKGYTFLQSPAGFTNAKSELLKHIDSRYKAVQEYLKQ